MDAATLQALAIIAGVGALGGLVGGFIASADNLFSSMLMGVIGGLALSAILRGVGVPSFYGVGPEDFSVIWGALGGAILGYVVGHSNV